MQNVTEPLPREEFSHLFRPNSVHQPAEKKQATSTNNHTISWIFKNDQNKQ